MDSLYGQSLPDSQGVHPLGFALFCEIAGLQGSRGIRGKLDLGKSYVVGDRWRDIDAGRAAGCYTILIERPYSQCTNADARVATLAAAVDHILAAVRPPEARTSGPGEGQEWIS
jgi:phosphoglycolate phosphatase-like HAD superfamily hydrolase